MKRSHGLILIYITTAAMMGLSWQRWCDPLVDFGREVYVPWQLAQGKVLYRDIAYFNGPVSPYFNAMVFQIVGEGILTLAIVNAILLAITLTLLHAILTKLSDIALATLACIVLIPLMCIAQPGPMANYNFITPYSHEITHALLLSFIAIACLMRLKRPWTLLAGFICGLVILTKPEIALACCIAIILSASLVCRWTVVLQMIGMMLIAPLIAAFVFRGDAFTAYQHIFDTHITSLLFYKLTMGTADIGRSLTNLTCATLVWAILVGMLMTLGRFSKSAWALPFFPIAFLLAIGLAILFQPYWWAAATPLILAMPLTLVLIYKQGETDVSRAVVKLAIVLFATALLGKIALNVMLSHYGFSLAMPAMAVLMIVLGSILPHSLASRGFNLPPMRGAAMGFFAGLALIHLTYSITHWTTKPESIGVGKDRIVFTRSEHLSAKPMLESLQSLPSNASVAIMPQGVMLNYLSRRENPTPYIVLMPPEVLMFGEDRILTAYQTHPPEYVLFVQTDVSEYGFSGFDAYAPKIATFLQAHYNRISSDKGYFLLRRK